MPIFIPLWMNNYFFEFITFQLYILFPCWKKSISGTGNLSNSSILYGYLYVSWLLHFSSCSLLITQGRQQKMVQVLGSCCPCRRPKRSLWLLAPGAWRLLFSCPNLGHFNHLGCELAGQRHALSLTCK